MNEIHDLSRVDAYARSRRRVAFLGAVWKPLLAGGVGAAIMAATVIGSVWVILPKISTREIVIDHVVQRDKAFDVYVPHDKPFDNYVPVAVQRAAEAEPPRADHPAAAGWPYEPSGSAPRPSSTPSSQPAEAPSAASSPPSSPKTAAEQKFTETPEYRSAIYRGRIVNSVDGKALSFAEGKNFWVAHWDDATARAVEDPDIAVDSDPFVGDLGMCAPGLDHPELWRCVALHNGSEIEVPNKSAVQPVQTVRQKSAAVDQSKSPPSPSPAVALDMIHVQVDLGGGKRVQAMVDTGASWPMSIPAFLADALVAKNLASRRPKPKDKTTLANGMKQEVGLVSIKRIVVDGHVLENVEAAVVPNRAAPVLLGLGALNRLGPFTIANGKLVFASQRPT